jgi:hypothetical protein
MVQGWTTHASLWRQAWQWRRPLVMIPLSRRVPGRASGPSQTRVDDSGGLQYFSWIDVRALRVFPMKWIYRQRGDVSGRLRGPNHLVARLGGDPRHPMVRPPPGLLRLSFGLRLRVRSFVLSNSENISCITFLKYKNSRKQELALWHLVNMVVPENAYKRHEV